MTLRERRIERGLTQSDVAEVVEVDQAAVSNWELGKCAPVRKYRAKLAALFGCAEDELLDNKSAPAG